MSNQIQLDPYIIDTSLWNDVLRIKNRGMCKTEDFDKLVEKLGKVKRNDRSKNDQVKIAVGIIRDFTLEFLRGCTDYSEYEQRAYFAPF